MTIPGSLRGERAVSDVLAFIIVFSIIITSVALVYGTGFQSISQIQEGEQQKNSVAAFEALKLSFDDLRKGVATKRGSRINLGGGQVEFADGPTLKVQVRESGTWDTEYENTSGIGSFQYQLEDTTVAYENGGVFRNDRGNSVNIKRSSMTCDTSGSETTAYVDIVVMLSPSNPLGASKNIKIEMEETSREIVYANYDPSGLTADVRVELGSNTAFEDGWDRHMVDENGWSSSVSGEYTCSSADQIVIRVTTIKVTFGTP